MSSPTRLTNGLSVANRGSDIKTEAPIKQFVIPMSYSDGTAENIKSDFVLPDSCVVLANVLVNVRVAEVTAILT